MQVHLRIKVRCNRQVDSGRPVLRIPRRVTMADFHPRLAIFLVSLQIEYACAGNTEDVPLAAIWKSESGSNGFRSGGDLWLQSQDFHFQIQQVFYIKRSVSLWALIE